MIFVKCSLPQKSSQTLTWVRQEIAADLQKKAADGGAAAGVPRHGVLQDLVEVAQGEVS